MRVARRVASESTENALGRARRMLRDAGVAVTELSDSNPTRHGLLHPGVLDALARHTPDAARYEPHPRGPRPAREALAQTFGGDPDDYWLASSTSQSYAWLFAVLADPGEAVAIPTPGYPLIAPLAALAGLGTRGYASYYAHPHGWVPDLASLRDAASAPDVRAVITVSPGNPTGAFTGAHVDDLVDVCAGADVALIADEVFAPFPVEGVASVVAGEPRVATFALGGLSKLLCAPQLKLAWIRVSGPEDATAPLRRALDTVADLFLPVGSAVAAALPALLGLAPESVARVRGRLRHNLDAVHRLFDDTAFRVRRCDGGWNVVVDVPADAATGDLALRLLERSHLDVHPGWFYDIPGDGALVVSLLPEEAAFGHGIAALRDGVQSLRE